MSNVWVWGCFLFFESLSTFSNDFLRDSEPIFAAYSPSIWWPSRMPNIQNSFSSFVDVEVVEQVWVSTKWGFFSLSDSLGFVCPSLAVRCTKKESWFSPKISNENDDQILFEKQKEACRKSKSGQCIYFATLSYPDICFLDLFWIQGQVVFYRYSCYVRANWVIAKFTELFFR